MTDFFFFLLSSQHNCHQINSTYHLLLPLPVAYSLDITQVLHLIPNILGFVSVWCVELFGILMRHWTLKTSHTIWQFSFLLVIVLQNSMDEWFHSWLFIRFTTFVFTCPRWHKFNWWNRLLHKIFTIFSVGKFVWLCSKDAIRWYKM